MSTPEQRLSSPERAALFALARAALKAHLAGAAPPDLPPLTPELSRVAGVFVTLRRKGELRGCIGHPQAQLPLAEAVRELAVSAGFCDHRFKPLQAEELPELSVELSVLSPLAPGTPEEVVVGQHGLLIRHRGRSGLLLPQVASERSWDPETFLRQTCRKAGLPDGSYLEPGCQLFLFSCEICHEG